MTCKVVHDHGDRKSPMDRVVGPLPNGRTPWLINGGDPNHLRPSWDDPPRIEIFKSLLCTPAIVGFDHGNPFG